MVFQREPVLVKELSRVRVPSRQYSFAQRIWFAKDWIIKREMFGETEVISTVVCDQPVSVSVVGAEGEEDEVQRT